MSVGTLCCSKKERTVNDLRANGEKTDIRQRETKIKSDSHYAHFPFGVISVHQTKAEQLLMEYSPVPKKWKGRGRNCDQ